MLVDPPPLSHLWLVVDGSELKAFLAMASIFRFLAMK